MRRKQYWIPANLQYCLWQHPCSWTEKRWIVYVAEKLAIHLAKRAMVNHCKPNWSLIVNVILQGLIGHCSCSFLSDIFINDQDNHTDKPQEVQQKEMPDPFPGKNNPTHYYRLRPARSKQICRSKKLGYFGGCQLKHRSAVQSWNNTGCLCTALH